MRTTRRETMSTGGAAALLVVSLAAAVLALGTAAPAVAAPVATDQATNTCWMEVIDDWLKHRPNVVGSYAIPCYTQAIQHLNSYADIQGYSNAPDDIHRALLAAYRNNQPNGPSSGSSSADNSTTSASALGTSSGSSGGGGSGSGGGGGGPRTSASATGGGASPPPVHKSIVTRLFDAVGPGNAQSIPLPLLVLAGLAVLLLLAAAGTWVAKRVQQRRMTPAPAPAQPPRQPS